MNSRRLLARTQVGRVIIGVMPRRGVMLEHGSSHEVGSDAPPRHEPRRLAVVFEPGRNGVAALAEAVDLLTERPTELTVLVVAPQERATCCGGASPDALNAAVRDQVLAELHESVGLLGPAADGARFRMLVERTDPTIEEWVSDNEFELVLLPARRGIRFRSHPAARQIRRRSPTEVRVISAARR